MAAIDDHPDFFISYTAVDEPWARWISHVLEEDGYRVRVQFRDFTAGIFPIAMERAIQRSRRLLVILSEAYLRTIDSRSAYPWQEFAAFQNKPEEIVPVQVEAIVTRSMARPYNRINLDGRGAQDAARRLREGIRTLVGEPSGPPPSARAATAPFPGRAGGGAPPDDDPVVDPPRVRPESGRLQLVLMGTTTDLDLAGLADRFAVAPDRILDLSSSDLPAREQIEHIATLLDDTPPDAVTDVVVVVAGAGVSDPDGGTRVRVRAGPRGLLAFGELMEVLTNHATDRRLSVLIDAVDGTGTSVIAETPRAVPVLDLRRPAADRQASGLAGLLRTLDLPPAELGGLLRHAAPLALSDLAELSGGTLTPNGAAAEPQVGLLPNPLATAFWGTPGDLLPVWCVVLSTADKLRADGAVADAMTLLARYDREDMGAAFAERGRQVALDRTAAPIQADEVFSSLAGFTRAVAQVCRAEIAVFDLTDYEPAVMLLLGIRAVIRRGVTLCVHTEHGERWRNVEQPFHLREISMLAEVSADRMRERLFAGIRQLTTPGRAYTDLPSFELLRGVPADRESRGNRPFDSPDDPTILALVPFDAEYTRQRWNHLSANVAKEAKRHLADKSGTVELRRTLDLSSPRVVSAQLYEAIRLTDFCLVDLTLTRPNVLFELGVRLAANRLHPIVVVDRTADQEPPDWPAGTAQRDKLVDLLAAIEYKPVVDDLDSIGRMVDRHRELRRLDHEPGNRQELRVLDGFPPSAVYDLAWQFAARDDEAVAIPLPERLEAAADALLVDPSIGSSHLLYPLGHPLSRDADTSGREHLIAAWLYQHFREQGPTNPDPQEQARYAKITRRLLALLSADEDDHGGLALADQIEAWRAEALAAPHRDEGTA